MNQITRKTLYKSAYIFDLIYTWILAIITVVMIIASFTDKSMQQGIGFVFLVPLAISVVITLIAKSADKYAATGLESSHLTLAIFSLIFMGIISGVLTILASSAYKVEKEIELKQFSNKHNGSADESKTS